MNTKYFKSTYGQSFQGFVTKAVAYTTQATYDLFVANAVEGEVGVYIVNTTTPIESKATLNASGNALTGLRFFIVQKRDGKIHKSVTYNYADCTVTQNAYAAPIKQVTNIGYTGTAYSMNQSTILPGQIYAIKILETTPLNQPNPAWAFEYVTGPTDTLLSAMWGLVRQINGPLSAQNQPNGTIASAALNVNGTFTANTVTSGNFGVTNGITTVTGTGHNVAAGAYIRIGGTTDAFPVYKVLSVDPSGNSFTLDAPYQGVTNAALAPANLGTMSGTTTLAGIQLTATNFDSHFKVAVQEDIQSATVTYTTPYREGTGFPQQVSDIEKEGQIFDGYTTLNYAFTADYGQPASFTDFTLTYQYIFINPLVRGTSKAIPNTPDWFQPHVVIATPVGVAPTTALTGMFV